MPIITRMEISLAGTVWRPTTSGYPLTSTYLTYQLCQVMAMKKRYVSLHDTCTACKFHNKAVYACNAYYANKGHQ